MFCRITESFVFDYCISGHIGHNTFISLSLCYSHIEDMSLVRLICFNEYDSPCSFLSMVNDGEDVMCLADLDALNRSFLGFALAFSSSKSAEHFTPDRFKASS